MLTTAFVLFRNRTHPYVIGVKGSCYESVGSVENGVSKLMNSIRLGEAHLV